MKIAVGLSGGVDSAVAAALLQQQGHEVIGVFMHNWDDDPAYCTTVQDSLDAAKVADTLGIGLHCINFAQQYRERVFAEFCHDLAQGITPNPDVLCNRHIKFTALRKVAATHNVDAIATGHYAQLKHGTGSITLHKAADANKDQSYFLHQLRQQQLAHAIFPLGQYHKTQVRQLALMFGLHNAKRRDSTGICFIGDRRKFSDFVRLHVPLEPGDIVDADGNVIGQHDGLALYTLGQRQGINIRATHPNTKPYFVADKDSATNTLVVVDAPNHPLLYRSHAIIADYHSIDGSRIPTECMAQTRYRQSDQPCRIQVTPVDNASHGISVQFAQPQRALTPGQYVVLYQGQQCLGGGKIVHSRA